MLVVQVWLNDLAQERYRSWRKIDMKLDYQLTLRLNLDYQWTWMKFEIDLRGIRWMFDQGLYNKVTTGTLDNNFDTGRLVGCHTKIREWGPASCSVRQTEPNCDGTVTEISQVQSTSPPPLISAVIRAAFRMGARRTSLRRDIYGHGKIAVVARERPGRHAATGPCNHTWPPAPLSSVGPRHCQSNCITVVVRRVWFLEKNRARCHRWKLARSGEAYCLYLHRVSLDL
jgi:hypothetical protein